MDSDCRVRVQTTGSGVGPMTGVVSVSEKAGQPVRCVLGRRTRVNRGRRVESELDVIKTGLGCLARDQRKRCLLTACVVTGMYTA